MFETRQISYVVKAYNTTFGRFTLENRAGDSLTFFLEDFDSLLIEGVEVTVAEMLAWLADNTPEEGDVLVIEDNVLEFVEQ